MADGTWSLVSMAMPTGLYILDAHSYPSPHYCDNQNVPRYFQMSPEGVEGGAESFWAGNHWFRAIWSLSNCLRGQIGDSIRLCENDRVKKSRGESSSIKWDIKSENIGWIHFNKETDSFWGFLLSTGSFKYINISHSTSNKGFQIRIPKTRLLMVFAFVIHFSVQPDCRRVCEPSGKKHKLEPANLACLSGLNWPGFFMRCLAAWVFNFILLFYVLVAYTQRPLDNCLFF